MLLFMDSAIKAFGKCFNHLKFLFLDYFVLVELFVQVDMQVAEGLLLSDFEFNELRLLRFRHR